MSLSVRFETRLKDETSSQLPCPLSFVRVLVNLYFKSTHKFLPMIDRKDFLTELDQTPYKENFFLLLNSLCALMTQQLTPSQMTFLWSTSKTNDPAPHPESLHQAFYESARSLLGTHFDSPHIHTLRALLILAVIGQGTNIHASSYHYIGMKPTI
jgi:hypothetical protein